MDKVRWGLLSTANINRRVIPAIRESQRGELVAVASRSEASAQAYAAEWEIPQAFGSYETMLDSGQVDAVYISLPNHLHADWSIRAMRAGLHVLCEKPFALTAEQVDAMIAASQETGQVLAEAFMYRHHPQTKAAGEWVRAGRLGEISLFRGIFNFYLGDREGNIRLQPEYGGGCLWDVGIYPMSFAQFIMGEVPESVTAEQWTGPTGVDETFCGQMSYSGSRLAQISSSFRTPFRTEVEILGSDGSLLLNKPFIGMEEGRRLIFTPRDGEPQEIPVKTEYLYLGEVEDMHAAILDGAQQYLRLSETRDHVRTLLALYAAARTGERVKL